MKRLTTERIAQIVCLVILLVVILFQVVKAKYCLDHTGWIDCTVVSY